MKHAGILVIPFDGVRSSDDTSLCRGWSLEFYVDGANHMHLVTATIIGDDCVMVTRPSPEQIMQDEKQAYDKNYKKMKHYNDRMADARQGYYINSTLTTDNVLFRFNEPINNMLSSNSNSNNIEKKKTMYVVNKVAKDSKGKDVQLGGMKYHVQFHVTRKRDAQGLSCDTSSTDEVTNAINGMSFTP